AASGHPPVGNGVNVWDAADGRSVGTVRRAGGAEVAALALDHDGARLAVNWSDGTVLLYETAGGRELLRLTGGGGYGIAFRPDGQRLFSRDGGGVVKVWDTTTGLETLSLTSTQPFYRSYCTLSVSPDGRRVAVSGLGQTDFGPAGRRFPVEIWDTTLPPG